VKRRHSMADVPSPWTASSADAAADEVGAVTHANPRGNIGARKAGHGAREER
jgi:hypothetical protein